MLTNKFHFNEIVQVVDPVTGIWEEAKICGFLSDWSVSVCYTKWSTTKKQCINIAENRRSSEDNWPIRKKIAKPEVRHGISRRTKVLNQCTKEDLKYEKERCQMNDVIHFVGPSVSDATDIPSVADLQRTIAASRELRTGTVTLNDPFLSRLAIDVDGSVQFIDYEQLRPSNWTSVESRESGHEEILIPSPPRKKPRSQPKLDDASIQAATKADIINPIVEYFKEITCQEDRLELTAAPCSNGIVRVGDIVIDEAANECSVTKLIFNGKKLKAMAEIQRLEDEDVTMILPAVRLMRSDKNDAIDQISVGSVQHPVNAAYAVLCALKRQVSVAAKKRATSQTIDLCHASEIAKRVLAFRKDTNKQCVCIF